MADYLRNLHTPGALLATGWGAGPGAAIVTRPGHFVGPGEGTAVENREIKTASYRFPEGDEARIERLFVEELGQEAIRFSWWTADGRRAPRPLDLSKEALLALFRDAVKNGVFPEEFLLSFAQIVLSRLNE
jgi:hypothetical protein